MGRTLRLILLLSLAMVPSGIYAQGNSPSAQQLAQAEKRFEDGNALMEQRKYAEALVRYKEALAILPNESSILYNGGLAAYRSGNYRVAAELWHQYKSVEPSDWQARAKLVQAYQALGALAKRDAERAELFEMWRSGKSAELKQQFEYCRDQFEVKGKRVLAFEHFELKGERALRYVFSILNEAEDGEEFRISLGSYDLTNAVWRETRNPRPKDDERLFHLDGYFKNGHATYGMYFPEPSYDEVRGQVVQILEGKTKAVSSSTVAPTEPKPAPKPAP